MHHQARMRPPHPPATKVEAANSGPDTTNTGEETRPRAIRTGKKDKHPQHTRAPWKKGRAPRYGKKPLQHTTRGTDGKKQLSIHNFFRTPLPPVTQAQGQEQQPEGHQLKHPAHKASHRGHSPAKPEQTPTGPGHQDTGGGVKAMTLLTWNVNGLNGRTTELRELLHDKSPDVLVLTETRLSNRVARKQKWLDSLLLGYTWWATSEAQQHTSRPPQGGVLVAIKDSVACRSKAQRIDPQQGEGRLIHVTLTPPHSAPIGITGAYAPAARTTEAITARERMHHTITEWINKDAQGLKSSPAHASQNSPVQLLLGDWNAVLHDADRTGEDHSRADTLHQQLAETLTLRALRDKQGGREHTYVRAAQGQDTAVSSRIDDILVNRPNTGHSHAEVLRRGTTSDHEPLWAEIDMQTMGLFLPTAEKPDLPRSTTKLVQPISQENKTKLHDVFMATQRHQIDSLHSHLRHIVETDLATHAAHIRTLDGKSSARLHLIQGTQAKPEVEKLAARLGQALRALHQVAMDTCATMTTQPGKIKQAHRTRAEHRQRKRRQTKIQALKDALPHVSNTTSHHEVESLLPNMPTGGPNAGSHEGQSLKEEWNELQQQRERPAQDRTARDDLVSMLQSHRQDLLEEDKAWRKSKAVEGAARWRQLINSKPKLAHRKIFANTSAQTHYRALAHPKTGVVTDNAEEMLSIIHTHFSTLSAAPTGEKHGKYHPQETPRGYPWEEPKAVDRFQLKTHASDLAKRPWLHSSMADTAAFDRCINTLANGKAAGPDGIVNDLLKAAPPILKEAIHYLFQIMWATGVTPDSWKTSDTCLLFKNKGQATDIAKYRPVGLLNIVYKLYTKLVTMTLENHAETHSILSPAQKGYRKFSHTLQQVQSLIMALEGKMHA
jgi:exonuclease III